MCWWERQEALGIPKVENENRKGPDSDPPHRLRGLVSNFQSDRRSGSNVP